MSDVQVRSSALLGTVCVPPSKSQTLRAILFGALGNGLSIIHHPLDSPDTDSMVHAVRVLGASVHQSLDQLDIVGTGGTVRPQGQEINAGSSGIVLRFCSALAASGSCPMRITGDTSLCCNRPMGDLITGLRHFGVYVASEGLFAPIVVQGPMRSGRTILDGRDSQPISALIIAAAFAPGPMEIFVRNPGERPWVDLTVHWLDRLGIPYERKGYEWYRVGRGIYPGFEYTVPGDFSSAAFPMAAALITDSELSISNLDFNDPQGDKELISVLQRMGARIEFSPGTVHVRAGASLQGIDVDVNNIIDAIPILSVVACFAEGETRLYNGAVARQKESNRIHCIGAELRKMGADVSEQEDGLVIRHSPLRGACVHTYNDHRLAMSLSVAGLGATGVTTVGPCECVAKTYSSFVRDFQKIGAAIEEVL
jgi:3-phosphoshikimate 1-carboxyvinyltransferase